jgi:hemoglobin
MCLAAKKLGEIEERQHIMNSELFKFHRHDTRPMRVEAPAREEILGFVKAFYAKARADVILGPVFDRVVSEDAWPEHFETMVDFWLAVAFEGPSFRGNPMVKHARIRDIAEEHFERWLAIFSQIARSYWPAKTAALLIFRAEQIAPALLAGIDRARQKGLVLAAELH